MITANFAVIKESIPNDKYREENLANMREWELLMSRSHYAYAHSNKYTELYGYIAERYGVDKLEKAKYKDSSDYIITGLLGENFETVDRVLKKIYKTPDPVSVFYDKNDKYVSKSIEYLRRHEGKEIVFSADAEIVVPKQKNPWKIRMLHKRPVYILAMMVFKKGSKIRKFLKKHL